MNGNKKYTNNKTKKLVEAQQFNGLLSDSFIELASEENIRAFSGAGAGKCSECTKALMEHAVVYGWRVCIGDYIIKDLSSGSIYVEKKEAFEMEYSELEKETWEDKESDKNSDDQILLTYKLELIRLGLMFDGKAKDSAEKVLTQELIKLIESGDK